MPTPESLIALRRFNFRAQRTTTPPFKSPCGTTSPPTFLPAKPSPMKFLGPPSSGSYQGSTWSRNRNGQYVRSRAVPVQPRTNFQLVARARLAARSSAFRDLDDYQRLAWGSLGALMTRTDALGQPYTLTGAQASVSINSVLTSYGQSPVDDAPLITTPAPPDTIVLTATAGTPTFTVATTGEPGSGFIGIYASAPQSAGRTFTPPPRLIATHPVGGSPYNILTPYISRFGNLVAGQKITVAVRSMLDGFESIPTTASVIVGA